MELKKRRKLKNMKISKVSLHSEDHHSFHIDLSPLESWELLARISKETWYLETGKPAPDFLDKTQVRIFQRGDDVSNGRI